MPKTTSTPTASRDRTIACAPVAGTPGRGVLSVIADLRVGGNGLGGQQKTPRAREARRGGASSREVDALGEYQDREASHEGTVGVADRDRQLGEDHRQEVAAPSAGLRPAGYVSRRPRRTRPSRPAGRTWPARRSRTGPAAASSRPSC